MDILLYGLISDILDMKTSYLLIDVKSVPTPWISRLNIYIEILMIGSKICITKMYRNKCTEDKTKQKCPCV